jgi:hypothetical protein
VEGAPLPKLICGHAVVNAGVTGASIEYFERHAAELLGSSRPRLLVLAVGINNASPTAAKEFQSHYQETVASLSHTAAVVVAIVTPLRNGAGSVGYDTKLVQRLKPSSSLFVFRGLTQANAGASAPDRRKSLHDTCSKAKFHGFNTETGHTSRPASRERRTCHPLASQRALRKASRSPQVRPVGFISADRADLHGGPLQNLATVRASVAPAPMSSPPKACTVQTAFWLLPLSNSEAIIDVTETLRAAARRSERS